MYYIYKGGNYILSLTENIARLNEFSKYEIWYIVKQEREFWKVCYAVRILEEYKNEGDINISLVHYFKDKATEIGREKDFSNFITTHRMLRVGWYYGLIRMTGRQYESAELTEVYYEIKDRCKGNFENIETYYDLIEQQIEKIYFSTIIDEKHDECRERYDLYPLFTLYKILLELGNIKGEYKISGLEFFVFVSTTEKYEDYFFTVYNILEYRENPSDYPEVEELYSKLSKYNRYKEVIKNLKVFNIQDTGDIEEKFIKIKKEYIPHIKDKIVKFEMMENKRKPKNYMDLLCSNKHLFPEDQEKKVEEDMAKISDLKKNVIDDKISRNLIIYGAPGTGKSWLLENEYRRKYFPNNLFYSRITLHENYSYSDFVGTYKPTPIYEKIEESRKLFEPNKKEQKKDNMIPHIDYEFRPGIFLEMYIKAKKYPEYNFVLIIEELNRANVASVFGNVFQLLDRNENGVSEYPIELDNDAKNYVIEELKEQEIGESNKIVIPSNLYIWATMNNADQNVTRIDTAFKRRWDFRHLNINFNEDKVQNRYLNLKFLNGYIKWNDFREVVNDYCMIELNIQEDRLIGTFFINEIEEIEKGKELISEDAFKYKLLMYLRDDLFRYNPSDIFKDSYSLGKLIEKYKNSKDIFTQSITSRLEGKISDKVDD